MQANAPCRTNVQAIAHPLYLEPSGQNPSKNTGLQRETSGGRWDGNCRIGKLLQVRLPERSDQVRTDALSEVVGL